MVAPSRPGGVPARHLCVVARLTLLPTVGALTLGHLGSLLGPWGHLAGAVAGPDVPLLSAADTHGG